jgi:hypothetical protein
MDDRALQQIIATLEGDFELKGELGRGATSIVYLLRDRALDRNVALKVIRGGYGIDEEAVARLEREAHLVAQLQHPNIVKLFGTHRLGDGTFALLMEHVPGRNLKEVLRSAGALPVSDVLEILKDVASALAYAHRRRIVHRDVKPENIYIDEEVGAARLADFGVARPWDQDSRLTVPGASLGTPAYMSPEQIDGKEVDGRSDVYSLGLVGYEMILGRHPWEGENVFTTIFKQKNELLPLDLPGLKDFPTLALILEKSLHKDPRDRWETAGVLLQELRTVVPQRRPQEQGPWIPVFETVGRAEERSVERGESGEGEEIDWGALGKDVRSADARGSARDPVLPERRAVDGEQAGDGVALSASPPFSPLAVPVRRKRRAAMLWGVLAVAILAGAFGSYWWIIRPGGAAVEAGPLSTVPPLAPSPDLVVPSQRDAARGAPVLRLLAGDSLQGRVGTLAMVAVRATYPDGGPLADSLVRFRVVEGEGVLDAAEVRTGGDGMAQVGVRLPRRVGVVVVEAALPGPAQAPLRVRFEAIAGPPVAVARLSGDRQSGAPGRALAGPIAVRITDDLGNVVPGSEVRFRVTGGGGSVRPPSVRTDGAGRAFARWTLGDSTGAQRLAVAAAGARDSLVTFEATAVPPADSALEAAPRPAPAATLPVQVRSQAFTVGGSHVCGIVRGAASCRGNLVRGLGGGASLEGLRALAAGVSHQCGLSESGEAWCWGANESGQLGDGTTEDRAEAHRVVTEATFTVLAGGLSHTCGLDARGAAYCWGRNLGGQLGDGTRTDHGQPGPVAGGYTFERMVAGWNHTCGQAAGGRTLCWGLNGDGQLGDGTRIDRVVPTRVPGSFRAMVAGAAHTCGISGDEVQCWGDNGFGQLGDGGSQDRATPAPVRGLPAAARALAAGAVHSCALLADGSAYCWGQNLHGQLGNGTTENSAVPVLVTGDLRFTSLHAGGGVSCGFVEDRTQYCWGINQGGQLGDGTRTNRSSPVRVGGQ